MNDNEKVTMFNRRAVAALRGFAVLAAALALMAITAPAARAQGPQAMDDASHWPVAPAFPTLPSPDTITYSSPGFHGGGDNGSEALFGWLLGTPTRKSPVVPPVGTPVSEMQAPSFKIGNWDPTQRPGGIGVAFRNHFRDGNPITWSAPFTFRNGLALPSIQVDDSLTNPGHNAPPYEENPSSGWGFGMPSVSSTATNSQYRRYAAVSGASTATATWTLHVPTGQAGVYSLRLHLPVAASDTSGGVLQEQRITDAHYNIVITDSSMALLYPPMDIKVNQIEVSDQQTIGGPFTLPNDADVTVTLSNETSDPVASNVFVLADSMILVNGNDGDVQGSPVAINSTQYPDVFNGSVAPLQYFGVKPTADTLSTDPPGVADPIQRSGTSADPTHVIRQVVYVGRIENGGGAVYCLDGFTGAVIWRFQTAGAVVTTPSVVRINVLTDPIADTFALRTVVIFGDESGFVYCLDAIGYGDGTSNKDVLTGSDPNYTVPPAHAVLPAHVGTTKAYWIYRPNGGTGSGGVLVDDSDTVHFAKSGTWTAVSSVSTAINDEYIKADVPTAPSVATDTATWTLTARTAGTFNLFAHMPVNTNGYSNATYTISGVATPVSVSQVNNTAGSVDILLKSSMSLTAGQTVTVTLSQPDDTGTPNGPPVILIADALILKPTGANSDDATAVLPVPGPFHLASPAVYVDPTTHTGTVYIGNSNGVMYALDATGIPGDPTQATYGDNFDLSLPITVNDTPATPPTPNPLWWYSLRGPNANAPEVPDPSDPKKLSNPVRATIEGTPALYVPASGDPTLFFGSSHEMEGTSNIGRLYAIDAFTGPTGTSPGSTGYNITTGGTTAAIKSTILWTFPNMYPGATGVDPGLGNISGSPVVFGTPGSAAAPLIYFAANSGIEIPAGGGTAQRPAADRTGRIWAVTTSGAMAWAYPNANDPNDATKRTVAEPKDPIGAFLHMTPAVGVVEFPRVIKNGDTTDYDHTDSLTPASVKGRDVRMMYFGTRGVDDTAFYALDLDATMSAPKVSVDTERFVYRVESPLGAMFQSSPLLIVNTSNQFNHANPADPTNDGNGGSVFITAGNTMYQFDATPISNENSGQSFPFVGVLPIATGFGSISSFCAAAADIHDIGITGASTDAVTDWLYIGDSSTGFVRGITPGGGIGINGGDSTDKTGGYLPGVTGNDPHPPAFVAALIPLQAWLFSEANSNSQSTDNAIPLNNLAPYEWGESVYVRISNVVRANPSPGVVSRHVADPLNSLDPANPHYYNNGSSVSFQMSQVDPQIGNNYGNQDYRLIPNTDITSLPGDGFIERLGSHPGENMEESDCKAYMGAFTYQIVPTPGQQNTPGSQRRIIGAQQTVERWTDTGTPSFVGSIVLQAGVQQGVQGYANGTAIGAGTDACGVALKSGSPTSQPTFTILNPIAERGGGIPVNRTASNPTGTTLNTGPDVGPFGAIVPQDSSGFTTGAAGNTYALRNGNEYYTVLPSGGVSGNTDPTATATAPTVITTPVISTTGQLSAGSTGDNAEVVSSGGLNGYTLDIADRSKLRQIGATLKVCIASVPLHWNDNTGIGNGEKARVNPLPWEDYPLTSTLGANNSQDYPDIDAGHLKFTVDPAGLPDDATNRAATVTPLTYHGSTVPITTQGLPLPVKIAIDVPKYQPANLQLFDPATFSPIPPSTGITDAVTPMGYVTTQMRVFVDSNNNHVWDVGEAYRDVTLYSGVGVDMSTSFADTTIDLGAAPHGFGVQFPNTSPFAPNPVAGSGTFIPYFKQLTIHNDGNVNLLNVHLNQQIESKDPATSTPFTKSMSLFSDPLDSTAYIPAYDLTGITGATNNPFLVRSSLDPDLFPVYENTSIAASYPGLTFHKARVTDSGPSLLTVPDEPRNSGAYTSGTPALPLVSVAVPVGTPSGTYSTRYDDPNLNLSGVKLGLFDAFDLPYNPLLGPYYGGQPGGQGGAAYAAKSVYYPGAHMLSSPGTTLKVTVTEDRMTDGTSSPGTEPHIDASGGAGSVDFSPNGFRDIFWKAATGGGGRLYGSGNVAMYWTSGRGGSGSSIYGSEMAYQPVSLAKPGAFMLSGGRWWEPLTSYPPAGPAGLNTGMTVAPSQEVYDASNDQFLSDGFAYGFMTNLSAAAPYTNTLYCRQVTTNGGAALSSSTSSAVAGELGGATNLQITPDTTSVKTGLRGLKIPLGAGTPQFRDPVSGNNFVRDLWAFWASGSHDATSIHYSSITTNGGVLDTQFSTYPETEVVTTPNPPGPDGVLPVPAGLTNVSDPSPVLVFGDATPTASTPSGAAVPYIDVTYTGVGLGGNADLYVSRYRPYHPQIAGQPTGVVDTNTTLLQLVPSPLINEYLQRVNGSPWWMARDVGWLRDSSSTGQPLALTDFTVSVGGLSLSLSGTTPTYDAASGNIVYPNVTLPGGALTTGTTATLYVDPARGRIRFNPSITGSVTIFASFHAMARRITTDTRQDTSPVSFIDDSWKPNDANLKYTQLPPVTFPNVQKSRYWYIWRKSGGAGDSANPTLYYKSQRLTIALANAGVPDDIGVDSNHMPIVTVTDVTGGGSTILYSYNSGTPVTTNFVDIDWPRGRIYLPMLWYGPTGTGTPIPMEGRTIKVDWYDSANPSTARSYTGTVRWIDEARVNDVKNLPVDTVVGGINVASSSSTAETAVPIDNPINEGTPNAFLDPFAYANVRQGSYDIYNGSVAAPTQPANVWLFWTSARNATGTAANPNDVYYETLNPRFSAILP